MQEFDILILGAGWTSTFLIPLLDSSSVSYAATTTTGRNGTTKWKFEPDSDDSHFEVLPFAKTVLITFPLVGEGESMVLISQYMEKHLSEDRVPQFIQLGSTGIWESGVADQSTTWVTRHSVYDKTDQRAIAEDELKDFGGCVLNLSGLWGGSRDARHVAGRWATTKQQVRDMASLHMIHGRDVARAILAVHRDFTPGERWMLTDGFVYDWWALWAGWGNGESGGSREGDVQGPHAAWVYELMEEEGVRALPRSMERLGRCYDTREFWTKFKINPVRARM